MAFSLPLGTLLHFYSHGARLFILQASAPKALFQLGLGAKEGFCKRSSFLPCPLPLPKARLTQFPAALGNVQDKREHTRLPLFLA